MAPEPSLAKLPIARWNGVQPLWGMSARSQAPIWHSVGGRPIAVLAAVFCQTVGHRPENPTVMYRHSKDNWEPDFLKRWPDVSTETTEKYFHNPYAAQPDFLYSVSRDFIKNCRTPMLVLPDDLPGHPLQTSIDVASLAPNAEITVYPWKEPEELSNARSTGCGVSSRHRSRCETPRNRQTLPLLESGPESSYRIAEFSQHQAD